MGGNVLHPMLRRTIARGAPLSLLLIACAGCGPRREQVPVLPATLPPATPATLAAVTKAVASKMKVAPAKIDPSLPLSDPAVGAADLAVETAIIALEQEFGVRIPGELVCDPKTGLINVSVARLAAVIDWLGARRAQSAK